MIRSPVTAVVLAALYLCATSSVVTAYSVKNNPSGNPRTTTAGNTRPKEHAATSARPALLGASEMSMPRRAAFKGLLSGALGLATVVAGSHKMMPPAFAADNNAAAVEQVYFGVGCFWHIQHEFLAGEKKILGRNEHEFTSVAGYAGGKSTDKEGRVCYHNLMQVADYGKLGHGEAVGLKLPADKIVDFTALYFSLFNQKTKDRVDPGDRGGEYRSVMGLAGGLNHPSYAAVKEVAETAGFQLVEGKGNDPDTLHKQIVYVYDTAKFPFYPGEVYHQYHDDFQSPPYGKAYNKLADLAFDEGRIGTTGCPDRV